MTINLVQLKGFCAVMQDSGYSVTKTAERIYIDHTALSRQISSLEKNLGIKLFIRTGNRRLKPTKEGQEFYNEIIVNFQNIDSLLNSYSKEKERERKNQIRIAGLDILLEKIIPYIGNLKEAFPNAEVSFYNISKEDSFKGLINNEIDLVFYPGDNDEICPIEIDKSEIIEEKVYWVFYENHPLFKGKNTLITGEKISEHPFGILLGGSYSQRFTKFIRDFKLKSPINLLYGTSDMIIKMIESKMCMSILSGFYLTDENRRDLKLVDSDNIFGSYLCFYTLKNTKKKEITEEFLKIIIDHRSEIFH